MQVPQLGISRKRAVIAMPQGDGRGDAAVNRGAQPGRLQGEDRAGGRRRGGARRAPPRLPLQEVRLQEEVLRVLPGESCDLVQGSVVADSGGLLRLSGACRAAVSGATHWIARRRKPPLAQCSVIKSESRCVIEYLTIAALQAGAPCGKACKCENCQNQPPPGGQPPLEATLTEDPAAVRRPSSTRGGGGRSRSAASPATPAAQ